MNIIMFSIGQVLVFCTILIVNSESRNIHEREKRFILSDDAAKKPDFKTPTPFPSPTPTATITQSTRAFNAVRPQETTVITGRDLSNSVVVTCPLKRSTSFQRVLLDERLMRDLYLTLLADMADPTIAKTEDKAKITLKHKLANRGNKTHHHSQSRHYHQRDEDKTISDFLDDLTKFHSWYDSVLNDLLETDHKLNDTTKETRTAYSVDRFEEVLRKADINKKQLEQLLGLVHGIDDLKHFAPSNKRIKRQTIGAVKEEIAYCNDRGEPTGTRYLHMCSACAQTTQFPENRFPRFVSEITCNKTDCDCFTVDHTSHGKCQPIIKNMKMLLRKQDGCRMVIKNGQQLIVDNWDLYEQPLHVGCECMFEKNSLYSKFIPKPKN